MDGFRFVVAVAFILCSYCIIVSEVSLPSEVEDVGCMCIVFFGGAVEVYIEQV